MEKFSEFIEDIELLDLQLEGDVSLGSKEIIVEHLQLIET